MGGLGGGRGRFLLRRLCMGGWMWPGIFCFGRCRARKRGEVKSARPVNPFGVQNTHLGRRPLQRPVRTDKGGVSWGTRWCGRRSTSLGGGGGRWRGRPRARGGGGRRA